MNARMSQRRAGFVAFAAMLALAALLSGRAAAQPADRAVHLGVASCAGSNCHDAMQPSRGSVVQQDEYKIWSKRDKHSRAYAVLLEARGQRIAHNLGLKSAADAPMCLGCHSDYVPKSQRGPQFQLSDGVGCEACHGGASTWLGVHISGATHQQNLAAGLYPTEQPEARAVRCLSCHIGDPNSDDRFVTHRIMAAGHPRMGFELDTYTKAEPPHFVVDADYIKRKGRPNDAQFWAVGQAVALAEHMNTMISPKRAPKGTFPEFVLFDCQSCHHAFTAQGEGPVAGFPPGAVRPNDANGLMLSVIARRLAPAAAESLTKHLVKLHGAVMQSWPEVVRQASQIRSIANDLVPVLARHDFTDADARVLARDVATTGLESGQTAYSDADQATMAIASLMAELKSTGGLNEQQTAAVDKSVKGLYGAFTLKNTYDRNQFLQALDVFRRMLPR